MVGLPLFFRAVGEELFDLAQITTPCGALKICECEGLNEVTC